MGSYPFKETKKPFFRAHLNKFIHMKRARQILTPKEMTNGEQHVSPIIINI